MSHSSSSAVYGLAFIGALVYNLQHASGIAQIGWGLIKSVLWPAFLVHGLLSFLKI